MYKICLCVFHFLSIKILQPRNSHLNNQPVTGILVHLVKLTQRTIHTMIRATDFLKRQLLTHDRKGTGMYYVSGVLKSLTQPVEKISGKLLQPQRAKGLSQ